MQEVIAAREFWLSDSYDNESERLSLLFFKPHVIGSTPPFGEGGWRCEYHLVRSATKELILSGRAGGMDSVQALMHALQQAAVDIYTSDLHNTGDLRWIEVGGGYGLPVLASLAHLAPKGLESSEILHVL